MKPSEIAWKVADIFFRSFLVAVMILGVLYYAAQKNIFGVAIYGLLLVVTGHMLYRSTYYHEPR